MTKRRSRRHDLGGWALALLVTFGVVPAEAQVGFSQRSGSLYRFDLVTDDSPIDPVWVGDTGGLGTSGSMAQGPDGRIYAAHSDSHQLYAIDPETAEATLIGDLDLGASFALWSDMTFDHEGRLWLVSQGTLFQVDPVTAATTVIATGLDGLVAVASHNGGLYGVAGDPVTSTWSLVSIDPTTGALAPLTDITGIESSGCFSESPEASDFDHAGGLWIAVNSATACIDPPSFHTSIVYLANPLDGTSTSRSPVGGLSWFPALALRRTPLVVTEVPVLGFSGLLLLSTVLAVAGLARLHITRACRGTGGRSGRRR